MLPSLNPAHETLTTSPETFRACGWETVVSPEVLHPAASVTVRLYVPAANPDTNEVDAPFDHEKMYGDVPPFTIALTVPFASPAQLTFVLDKETPSVLFSSTVAEFVPVQPFASVTIRV
ncbi:MAG: hypothetical protein R2850_00465 [Bacteroidia bacterium]